jgi:uncharacterized protein
MRNLSLLAGISLLAISLVISSGCGMAVAQDRPNDKDDDRRTISVSGSGSIRVKPDLASAVLGTTKSAAKLPEAKNACDATIAQIKAALKKAGIAEEDIQTVQYQIYRVNANPQAGIRESSWKVVHMVQVRTKKPETIASVVDSAVAAGATDVQHISFSVDSLAKHRAKARELAVAAAKDKALQLASLLKVNVGEVVSVAEGSDGYYPMAQMAANSRFEAADGFGGGGSDISGGQIEVNTVTNVVFEIR